MTASKPPRPANLPYGRWLGDFPRLSAAEKDLVAKCAAGEGCVLGDGNCPTKATSANTIRAGLIRFLMLGGDDAHPVHEYGVRLQGAWIKGAIRLDNVESRGSLGLLDCWIAERVVAQDATFTNFALSGCRMPGLKADRLVVKGSVFLKDGLTATGEVKLPGAQIGGNLECTGGKFCNAGKDGGALGCALNADGIEVTGDVFLDEGFTATGEVRLLGAHIGGVLSCSGGTFRNADKDGKPQGNALAADSIVVMGGFFVRAASFLGRIDLSAAHVASLVDDSICWPDCSLILDGFQYDRVAASPMDAAMRIGWLEKQYPSHLGNDFRPQPWEQLIKVLREMGHSAEAAEVAMAKQRALRKAGKIGQRRPDPRYSGLHLKLDRIWVSGANLFARVWHRIYGRLAGFGYRPTGILMWMVIVAGLSGAYFSTAADAGLMAPTSAEVFTHKELHDDLNSRGDDSASCGIQREVSPARYWPACTELPSEYTAFNPWWYSIDLILPLVDLQQDSQWNPAATYTDAGGTMRTLPGGVLARLFMWFEILFGWFASLMFVAIASRLVEKD